MVGSIFFVFCSLVALTGALVVVLARNAIRAAVGLLATVLGMAGLFLLLSAQFLAAIQIIVYAGAVVVLFVFVIMLLGPDPGTPKTAAKGQIARPIGAAVMIGLAVATLFGLVGEKAGTEPFSPAHVEHGSVEAVGGMIFTRGLVPFELATALLIVAIVGAIAMARRKLVPRRATASDNPTERLFGGPVHPRDAGRPLTDRASSKEPLS
jgi:NADH-quinone oxidoreductase subunit J